MQRLSAGEGGSARRDRRRKPDHRTATSRVLFSRLRLSGGGSVIKSHPRDVSDSRTKGQDSVLTNCPREPDVAVGKPGRLSGATSVRASRRPTHPVIKRLHVFAADDRIHGKAFPMSPHARDCQSPRLGHPVHGTQKESTGGTSVGISWRSYASVSTMPFRRIGLGHLRHEADRATPRGGSNRRRFAALAR